MIKFNSPKKVKSIVILATFLLQACAGSGSYAPVIERINHVGQLPKSHIVVRGETLFSIAWRYGIDFKRLVSANNIDSPYTIYPGQKLLLNSKDATPITAVRKTRAKPGNTVVAQQQQTGKSESGEGRKPTNGNTNGNIGVKKPSYLKGWRWPIKGKVLTPFRSASSVHKGIDIRGKLGEPVHAANSGKVVYAGSGLVGYGKLLIVKHGHQYLSAYGHNSKLLVKEGDLVKVGQRIADVGDSGTDKVMLHFEIRLNGKPVNPLKLLK